LDDEAGIEEAEHILVRQQVPDVEEVWLRGRNGPRPGIVAEKYAGVIPRVDHLGLRERSIIVLENVAARELGVRNHDA
jgi:hypothetical protein